MYKLIIVLCICLASVFSYPAQAHDEKVDNSGWWDQRFWNDGYIDVPDNYDVESREVMYKNADIEIPAVVLMPKTAGNYPAVLFVHGRRGLDELVLLHARRLAARGFKVFAPDLYTGRDIAPRPIAHDYVLEDDLDKGLDFMLTLPEFRENKKVCVYSHTRGGYKSLKLAVTKKRQDDVLACYVSYYPHWQDPNAPEPMQVYGYALEADELKIPAMIFIGDEEQYQRRRVIETAVGEMKRKQRPVTLVVYPGVGRGFDFRPENIRTFADDLATRDALQRSARFMRKCLIQ